MPMAQKVLSRLWSIILAGGNGERLQPTIWEWLGEARPKQYCVFTGTRSMLEHTWDRADRVTEPDQKVTVVAKAHWPLAVTQYAGREGHLVVQPANRDTAAGVFLPVTYVRAWHPGATVVIYPSDHFVYPEEPFLDAVRHALSALETLGDRVILLGVRPDDVEMDYGWVQLGEVLQSRDGHGIHAVAGFTEKPDALKAREAFHAGSLWNTFVMVTRLETLWQLGWRCLPTMMPLFDQLEPVVGTEGEQPVLDSLYRVMPCLNFSTELLQRVPSHVAVLELQGVHWSDWGRAERIATSLNLIGKEPAFATRSIMRNRMIARLTQGAPVSVEPHGT